MDQLTIGASYARALVARLALVLTSRTGSSLTELELSMLFIALTNLILKNCRAQDPRSPPGFMLDIVCALVDLLSDLNIDATSGKLLERDEKAVLSTLIASKVLKIALLVNWSPEALGEDEFDEPLNHCGIGSSSAPDIRGDSFEVYTFPVPAALNIDIHAALEVLLTIVSSAVNYQTVLLLRTQPQGLEDAPAPPPDRSRVHALEIDANILLALKYLAACNASQYCLFLHHKLFSWAERGEHIPTPIAGEHPLTLYIDKREIVTLMTLGQAPDHRFSQQARFSCVLIHADCFIRARGVALTGEVCRVNPHT